MYVLRCRRRYWLWHLLACAMYAHGKGHCCHAYDCQHDDVACSNTESHQLADSEPNCAQCSLCLLWDMQILFQGPHVKMGVYRGRPTGVSPHVTTGRADYFGPFVNRSGALLTVSILVTHPTPHRNHHITMIQSSPEGLDPNIPRKLTLHIHMLCQTTPCCSEPGSSAAAVSIM